MVMLTQRQRQVAASGTRLPASAWLPGRYSASCPAPTLHPLRVGHQGQYYWLWGWGEHTGHMTGSPQTPQSQQEGDTEGPWGAPTYNHQPTHHASVCPYVCPSLHPTFAEHVLCTNIWAPGSHCEDEGLIWALGSHCEDEVWPGTSWTLQPVFGAS